MKIEIKTDSYNERRYSAPYIARVEFDDPKGNFTFGDWVGDRRNGTEGLLTIEAEAGDIIAIGQKDLRKPANSSPDYFQVLGPADREGLRRDAAELVAEHSERIAEWASTAGPACLPNDVEFAYYAFQRVAKNEKLTLDDCRSIIRAFTGAVVNSKFKGNIEVMELSKADAYKAWQAQKVAASKSTNPLAVFSDAEIMAEARRRALVASITPGTPVMVTGETVSGVVRKLLPDGDAEVEFDDGEAGTYAVSQLSPA